MPRATAVQPGPPGIPRATAVQPGPAGVPRDAVQPGPPGIPRGNAVQPGPAGAVRANAVNPTAPGAVRPNAINPATPVAPRANAVNPAAPGAVRANTVNPAAPGAPRANAANPAAPGAAGRPAATSNPDTRSHTANPSTPGAAQGNAANPAAPGAPRSNAANQAAPGAPSGNAANQTAPTAVRSTVTNPSAPAAPRGSPAGGNAATDRPGSSAALNPRDGAGAAGRGGAAGPVAAGARVSRGAAVVGATAQQRHAVRLQHRAQILGMQRRLPVRPLPGMPNFTGVPPAGETRFVSTEVVLQVGQNVSRQTVDDMARRFGLTVVASHRSVLTGGTLFHFRVAGTRPVAEVVRALEGEKVGVAQPNYVYQLTQDETAPAQAEATPAQSGAPEQYVAQKLRLEEAHKLVTGKNVLVAVLDSAIDTKHPDLADTVVETFDAAGKPDKPHTHGTGMAGAVAAHGRLTGVAPGATVLAVNAFGTGGKQSPQATTRNIIAGLEWALQKGARVINMSFAGPYDPMLQVALKKAHEKGAVLIAAAGNQGPKSPPLYPAADKHVIAVTATDENDAIYSRANRGPHVAIATPGVDVLAVAPDGNYEMTTGTSVATAHASGVAALLIERHPEVDAKTVLEVLTVSAMKLGAKAPDEQFGWGLIDPVSALEELEARLADNKLVATAKPAPPKPAAQPPAAKPAPQPPAPTPVRASR